MKLDNKDKLAKSNGTIQMAKQIELSNGFNIYLLQFLFRLKINMR